MTADLLELVGLFVTATGVLLVFAYLWQSPRFAKQWLTPEGQKAFIRHQRLLTIAVGLLALWFLLQYLGVILA